MSRIIKFKKRFIFAESVRVPFPKKINEGFEIDENYVKCNVSFEKLEPLLIDFIEKLQEPLFIAIHIPLQGEEAIEMRNNDNSFIYDEVLYLDGCSKADILQIWSKYGEIILKDGLSKFAVISQKNRDEFFIEKYKIVYIFSNDKNKYIDLLKAYNIEETTPLITVWDTFSNQHPGMCRKFINDNKDIFFVVEELKKKGMYRKKIEKKKGNSNI